ncbi:hypothetical protein BU16DRAFT_546697 [Lophium mytilinum]|uniref:Zn(2)-C6 fungal-type domain-containing protein n=1 Tax=Lophium mytilinum TaxID=390894 RepID=A0A6A6RAQ0_9PEZI|nr:hypothetical protein BU16DRAFT_546697 [Lophium mytilinum]
MPVPVEASNACWSVKPPSKKIWDEGKEMMKTHAKIDGCWTCKLRRKKCDELRPRCGDCDSLEISCDYGPKPAWMDGEEQQRQRTVWLKNEIKRNSAYRREKSKASSRVTNDTTSHHFNIISNIMVSSNLLSTEPIGSVMSGDQTSAPASNSATSYELAPFTLLPYDHQHHPRSDSAGQPSPIETDFIMKYLDFVFPALFPFYRPAVLETGRSWLLLLLGKSKIAYHSIVSLSCYFFTMALTDDDSGEEHADCKQLRWKEVEQQTNKCFDSLRTDILALDLNSKGAPATKLERVEILGSVVQVLIFESALGKSAPWNSHLPPAFALFGEIMACSDPSYQGQGQSKLAAVLLEIGQPLWTKPGRDNYIWSPDQAGFRFCAGLLIFIDVVASTAVQESPRLISYYPDILARIDDGTSVVSGAEIRLSTIVGCRNWVVTTIAEISALNSWKRERTEATSLSVVELVNRASVIGNSLKDNILEIHINSTASLPSHPNYRVPFSTGPNPSDSSIPTLIWAHAAQLYLTLVVSGWQSSNPEVRTDVAQIIELLHTVPSYQLRALAWPLCVAGCLALESEESSFTALYSNLGKVYTAGALDDARQIMEKVWRIRPHLNATTWNLASCFSILGSPILLV